jgi:hypothetical protein
MPTIQAVIDEKLSAADASRKIREDVARSDRPQVKGPCVMQLQECHAPSRRTETEIVWIPEYAASRCEQGSYWVSRSPASYTTPSQATITAMARSRPSPQPTRVRTSKTACTSTISAPHWGISPTRRTRPRSEGPHENRISWNRPDRQRRRLSSRPDRGRRRALSDRVRRRIASKLLTGGAELTSPDAAYVNADKLTYAAVAPEYLGYVNADPALTPEQKARRGRTVATWWLRITTGDAAPADPNAPAPPVFQPAPTAPPDARRRADVSVRVSVCN